MIEKDRNWTFIVYPESAPSNWRDLLQETGLPIAISPLHNIDINEATGEVKKAHYHVLLCFPGPTTFMKVNKICAILHSPIPKRILSVQGIYRYFTHKDNPEKAQYNEDDIVCLNGFDIEDKVGYTTNMIVALKKQIQHIIEDKNITSYRDLMNYLDKENFDQLYYIASINTYFFTQFINGKKFNID